MPKKVTTRKRPPRLVIPARLQQHLPKIHWALLALRNTIHIDWITTKKDEPKAMPFMSDFDDQTQATIDRIRIHRKAPKQSRSAVVTTALEIYTRQAKAPDPDRGLRKSKTREFPNDAL